MDANLKNVAFKLLHTMLNAGLAALVVIIGDLDVWWGAAALAVIQVVSGYLRERFGETTPDMGSPVLDQLTSP